MENNLPLGGPVVNLTKVAPLNKRRSVTLMNNFLMNTSNFLNNFAVISEENIAKQSVEMQKLKIALNILEAKLDSIPGLDGVAASQNSTTAAPETSDTASHTADAQSGPAATTQPAEEPPSPDVVSQSILTVENDPRYVPFLKKLKFQVPLAAMRDQMLAEGLDPSLLETPDAPVPDHPAANDDADSGSMSSGDGFSD